MTIGYNMQTCAGQTPRLFKLLTERTKSWFHMVIGSLMCPLTWLWGWWPGGPSCRNRGWPQPGWRSRAPATRPQSGGSHTGTGYLPSRIIRHMKKWIGKKCFVILVLTSHTWDWVSAACRHCLPDVDVVKAEIHYFRSFFWLLILMCSY